MGPFNNPFTEESKQVIKNAQKIAVDNDYTYVGSEHLLLALYLYDDEFIKEIFRVLYVTESHIRNYIESNAPVKKSGIKSEVTDMRFSPSATAVLKNAYRFSDKMGGKKIAYYNILQGILQHADQNPESTTRRIIVGDDDSEKVLDFEWIIDKITDNYSVEQDDKSYVNSDNLDKPEKSDSSSKKVKKSGKPKQLSNKKKTPTLNQCSRDLTELAIMGKLDPVVGRDEEINRVITVLNRRSKCNPVLIGDPGVGKTAVVEGLAHRIVKGEVPERLLNKRIVSLQLSSLVAGTRYRGEFEERVKKVMTEVTEVSKDVILFIDELHTLVGAGSAEGSLDAANILKPSLSRGELQCIGATTLKEYTQYIEKDAALERRFQPIEVKEPTQEQAIDILIGLRDRYEEHHKVSISDIALRKAVELSARYVGDRFLPDKAIDAMDEAASRVSLSSLLPPNELLSAQEEIEKLKDEQQTALAKGDYDKAASLKESEDRAKEQYDHLKQQWEDELAQKERSVPTVTEEDIANVISMWTGVPVNRLTENETIKLAHIEDYLHKRVIGQNEPIKVVGKSIKRARTGLKDPNRPIGSFLFLGPTGVGKTELARTLADFLFDDEDALIKLDMSEYSEKFTASRLGGAPPGYVGYEEGGQLSDAVRRRPYCVVLFDEIEKADPEVFNKLLQILDEGRFTDSHKRNIDFKNTVIVLTSNLGFSDVGFSDSSLGFRGKREDGDKEARYRRMSNKVMEETKKNFRPEFLNRLDATVVFHSLDTEHLLQILDIMLGKMRNNMNINKRDIVLSDSVKKAIVDSCDDLQYGARPLRRALRDLLEDPLSDKILLGEFPEGSTMIVDLQEEPSKDSSEEKEKEESQKDSDREKHVEFKYTLKYNKDTEN